MCKTDQLSSIGGLAVCEVSKGSSLLNLSVDIIMQMANWPRNVLFGSVVVVIVIASQTSVADDKLTFRVAPGERQLFPDDVGISTVSNLKRTMHQPSRRGAVIAPDQPWETTLQTCCTPVWDEERGVYKIWMITSTNIPGLAGTSYAESNDGLHPFRILPINLHVM